MDLEPKISLAYSLEQLAEAHDGDDDWTGLKDRAERKKRQNRLNQRAWRRRQAESRALSSSRRPFGSVFVIEEVGPSRDVPRQPPAADAPTSTPGRRHQQTLSLPERPRSPKNRRLIPPIADLLARGYKPWSTTTHFDDEALPAAAAVSLSFPLSPDHQLITLVQYNVLRGTMLNMAILRLLHTIPPECQGTVPQAEIQSSVVVPHHPSSHLMPAALRPTVLQQTVPHASWIDVVPDPAMRDNLIRLDGKVDNDALCGDLVGGLYEGLDDCERRGIMVWGDPWLVESWEVSEGFARRWGFLLGGCSGTVEATDRWREVRGEESLDWAACGVVVEDGEGSL